MKKIKGLTLIMLFLSLIVLFSGVNNVSASNLTGMIKSSGSALTYTGSGEQVQMLSEYNYPTGQFRAAWVSHFAGDISSYSSESQYKSMMTTVLDNMESWGMNAIVYHVRTHNNAMYKSELNPVARWWANVDFDTFDPLEWLIDECHNRGMEFHAWMNPYRISTDGTTFSNSVGTLPAVNPANDASNLIQVGNSVIFNPGSQEVRDFLVDTCMEVVENYDIDAIHFDDYFYISGYSGSETADEKRENVNMFIESLHNALVDYNTENNKAIQLGISPSGIYRNGSYSNYPSTPSYDANGNLTNPVYSATSGFAHYDSYLYSDTLKWINEEWIDYILPQMYWATEHSGASYVDIGRWWSWAVRNKDVNLYSGLGIYMALDPTSSSGKHWQYNTDEIERQLLFMGQFEEFDGACFYKYASLMNTSNELIQEAKTYIKDKWAIKKVPGAVIKAYADEMVEVAPTNVLYNSTTTSISYSAVDNVRGYMVYQVPKGETLNKNNINHVYEYTQETTLKVTNIDQYDYYVASVNLANETSSAVLAQVNFSYQTVIDAINALPTTITYADKDTVESARALYEALTEEDKALVTNINKLVAAEVAIINYEEMQKELEEYILTLDLHIKENKKIPLKSGMTLAYKNSSDSKIYNIETGERLKNYLATKLITLTITYTVGDYSVSSDINVNVGLTATSQVGLFYRNDPSTMSEDDEGAYTTSDSEFIGWSGHTLVVENNVLYIADRNYFEVTDATSIESCHWSSVAAVYINKTSSAISIPLANVFGTYSTTDGYIIIANNQVKATSTGLSTSDSITLEADETLVITRFLDGKINGSPLYPATKVAVGTKAYIDAEENKTIEELANEVIELINTIPTDITLEDETLINQINAKYNNLSNEAKELVTNYETLSNALNTLESIKTELVNSVINQISSLPETITLADEEAVNNALISYNNLSVVLQQKVTNVSKLTSAVNTINALKEELNDAKQDALEELESLRNQENFSEEGMNTIETAINNAISVVNTSITVAAIEAEVANVKNQIETLKTTDDTYVRYVYTKKVDDLLASYTDVSEGEKIELEAIAENFKGQIAVGRLTELDYLYSRAVAAMSEYFDNAENARQEAIAGMNEYLEGLTYSEKENEYIKNLATSVIENIPNMTAISEIKEVVNNFKAEIEILHEELVLYKETTINDLTTLISSWYNEKQKAHIQSIIDKYEVEINLSGTKQEVDTIKAECESEINTYITEVNQAIDDAKTYMNSKKLTDVTEINDLISRMIYLVVELGTKEEVEQIVSDFDTQYDEILVKLDELDNISSIRNQAKIGINEYVSTLEYSTNELAIVRNQKTELFKQIDLQTSKESIDNLVLEFKTAVEKAHEELVDAQADAKYIVGTSNATTDKAASYIEETLVKIDAAASASEVAVIMQTFNTTFDDLNVESSCDCAGLSVIFILMSITTLFTLLFRKK